MPQKARYRIRAVSEKTGIPSATLRAWERRYGIPNPFRTESAYRLYHESDIQEILQLKKMTESGLAPSEAARILKLKRREGAAPESSQSLNLQQPPPPPEELAVGETAWVGTTEELANHNTKLAAYESARSRIFKTVKQFDPISLERAIREAMMMGSARLVFDEIFAPVLRQIGESWHQGELSIAQEHFATEQIGNATRELLRLVQPDQRSRSILLACVQGEFHVLPLYGIALHLVQYGYRVTLLGANTPPEALGQSLRSLSPSAVGLSITHMIDDEKAESLLKSYQEVCGGCPLLIGGRGSTPHQVLFESTGVLVSGRDPATLQRRLYEEIRAYERSKEPSE